MVRDFLSLSIGCQAKQCKHIRFCYKEWCIVGAVPLDEHQQELRKKLVSKLEYIKGNWEKLPNAERLENELGVIAHELHMSLTPKPKHHRYMIENRGVSPDHPDFYKHIHPVEDLLDYLEDNTANDDPEDQTINHDFKMQVYSRRWGHKDEYKIKRTETGWLFEFGARGGPCDKLGKPNLYNILDADSINYPEELGGYIEWLWNQAKDEGLSHEEVQSALDDIADWISACEINTPRGVFRGYK